MLTAFPDYRIVVEDQIAEGNRVATVWTASGTYKGELENPAGSVVPTGRQVKRTATASLRHSGGRISEVLASSWDHLGILKQLDAAPTTEPGTGCIARRYPYPEEDGPVLDALRQTFQARQDLGAASAKDVRRQRAVDTTRDAHGRWCC